MFKFFTLLKSLLACTVLASALQAHAQSQPAIKVVYHLSDGIAQATRAIGNDVIDSEVQNLILGDWRFDNT